MRDVPHDPWHRRRRPGRTGPDASGDAEHDWRRHGAKHTRTSRVLDPRSATPQTRQPDAANSPVPRGSRGTRGVSAHAPMIPNDHTPIAARSDALERTWADPRGFIGWFAHVDHKSIGRRYLVTAFSYFLLGGVLAAVMRLQLARPDNTVVGPDLYNQIFTTHGTTMMFLFAVPVMQGLGIYFLPLMVGARAIAFPRLVAFSYWMFLFGGLFLYVSFLLNAG